MAVKEEVQLCLDLICLTVSTQSFLSGKQCLPVSASLNGKTVHTEPVCSRDPALLLCISESLKILFQFIIKQHGGIVSVGLSVHIYVYLFLFNSTFINVLIASYFLYKFKFSTLIGI